MNDAGTPRWLRRLKLQHFAIVAFGFVVAFPVSLVLLLPYPAFLFAFVVPFAIWFCSSVRLGMVIERHRIDSIRRWGCSCPKCSYDASGVPRERGTITCPECGWVFDPARRFDDARKSWGEMPARK